MFAHLTWPVMPAMARTIHEAIQPIAAAAISFPGRTSRWRRRWTSSNPARPFKPPDVLFAKITDEQVAEWKVRFGGSASGAP